MDKSSRIWVAGHTGMVGSALVRCLKQEGYSVIIPRERVDLLNYMRTYIFFNEHGPEYVFNAAASAGGIKTAIEFPADMIYENAQMQLNLIELAKQFEVKKLINIGSSCIYPLDGLQPYKEEQLGTGRTDENWSYAVAKLLGIEMCRAYYKQYDCNFMSVIPCNIYGPNDRFDPTFGHVIPSLIHKFFNKEDNQPVEVWGDGSPKREFMYVDDLADCLVWLMKNHHFDDLHDGVINVGTGKETSIQQLVLLISDRISAIFGSRIKFQYDMMRPMGVPRKMLETGRINNLGWEAKTDIVKGLGETINWYNENIHSRNKSGKGQKR